MAQVIITLRVMPESPDVDMAQLADKVKGAVKNFGGEVGKEDIKPVAFGLKSLDSIFIMDEAKGSTDKLEEEISSWDEVASCEVTDVRRAIG
jgi:elongation factor 1-beta